MQCPRCEESLSTFSVQATGETAVVCEACGFTGIATTHGAEQSDIESWDRAMRRFERTDQSTDETCETGRAETVSVPGEQSGPDIDPDALEASVAVATALEEADDENPESASETLEESVAVATVEESSDES
jgi:hypothetical protein